MIEIEHLTYTYPGSPAPALVDLSLRVNTGEFVLIAGPSGAGKSTLLRCLNGLVPHFTGGTLSGKISVEGHDPVREGPHVLSRIVGFVFQEPHSQFVMDRVEDEIAFALENAAMPPGEMRVRVEEVMHLLDLTPLRSRKLETLSGGEQQRVAIAAALAFRPRILVLDEPTSQLDPQSAEDVLQALVRLNQEWGLTILLAEHRLERVLPYVDRLVYLPGPNGRAPMFSGPPREVLPHIDLTPPLITVGKALRWEPLPLTLKEGRAFAARMPALPPVQRALSVPPRENAPLLRIQDLHFSYDHHPALCGVHLTISPGETIVLMGRNGAGKTTLLKCIVGLLRPQRGQIWLNGEPITGQPPEKICQRVGYLPQEPDMMLFADTVMEELWTTLRNHGLQHAPPVPPCDLLVTLGLEGYADAYPRDLSAGQRQRVALGAIAVTRPRLLLLDEPTRGLDYWLKQQLVRLLRTWKQDGTAVLLATHDVEFAAQIADRVVILSNGQVVVDDQPTVLAASPLFAPQVARLFPDTGWLTAEDVMNAYPIGV
ncbi:MAG: ATP-binding cassette domain-containing protein [Anaerolineae bacterium]|nr:ATP-binding cassette domain-containing protein [Anaerolineae bacterium]MDW8067594.1 ATP-binding cassette domain-containing protein [Anaerolineae bacterium]